MNTLPASHPTAMLLPPQLRLNIVAVLLLLLSLAATLFLSGCATQDVPGRLLASTVQTVDSAMQGWSTYVALGKSTVDQENAVRAAYTKYQAAEQAAETAYIAYVRTGDVNTWQRASDALKASQRELLGLLKLFAPP